VIKTESLAILGWPLLSFMVCGVVGSVGLVGAGAPGVDEGPGFGWVGFGTLGILTGNWADVI